MDFLHDILHSLINHFIPHEGNDYRPHLLQKAAFFGLVGMVVLSFTIANFQALLWQSSPWLVGAVLPAVVIDLTNEQRAENNLSTLERSAVLDAAANLKAQDMAKGSYFAHNSPTGVTPWHWFDEAGYTYVYAGENLAVFFTDSSAVVDAWMKSPTHRANIVGSHYTQIGVGTAKGKYNGYDTVFVVQLFGTPAMKLPTPVAVAKPVPVPVPVRPAVAVATSAAPTSTLVRRVLGAETAVASSGASSVSHTKPARIAKVGKATGSHEQLALTAVEPVPVGHGVSDGARGAVALATQPTVVPVPDAAAATQEHTFTTDDVVGVQSDMATSHTNLQPEPVLSADHGEARPLAPTTARLATEPHRVLQFIYLCIGVLTMLALFASVIIEWQQHRPLQTAYGIVLLALMCGLFILHTTLTAHALII